LSVVPLRQPRRTFRDALREQREEREFWEVIATINPDRPSIRFALCGDTTIAHRPNEKHWRIMFSDGNEMDAPAELNRLFQLALYKWHRGLDEEGEYIAAKAVRDFVEATIGELLAPA
jgi:hypothetical protein